MTEEQANSMLVELNNIYTEINSVAVTNQYIIDILAIVVITIFVVISAYIAFRFWGYIKRLMNRFININF